jgi:hypothetical protein
VTSRLRVTPRNGRVAGSVFLAICAATLLAPASVTAAVTIGQTAPTSASVGQIGGATPVVQHQVAGPPTYAVPEGGGVITSWSVQGGNSASGQVKLKLVRPAGSGTSYTVVGEDVFRPITQGAFNTFPAQIPVTGGELLSLWVPSGAISDALWGSGPGDAVRWQSGSPPEPGIGQDFPTNMQLAGRRINVSAVVEPDCDQDGLGDESQDPELSLGPGCGKGSRTLTLDTNKSKVKKGRKVVLSGRLIATAGGPAQQGECLAAQTVQLQQKKPGQTSFTTFAQVQSDAQGQFSLKQKVKKTSEFRAQLPETATCGAGESENEKVKVKRKK